MKRRDLERRLRIAGCYLKREGALHSLWINPKNGAVEAIPRHIEIKEPLAKKIFEESECRMNDQTTGLSQHAAPAGKPGLQGRC
jgi:mRNA interferase HicA